MIAGALVVLASRLLTFPRTPWELDEFLFLEAVRKFEPLRHHPHPPGYPLFVFLGKVAHALIPNAFAALVALSIAACVIGWIALYRAFRNMIDDADVAAAGALLFYLCAGMLIHSPLALADATAIMFLALTFYALGTSSPIASAIFASAAIGCRPQLAVPLLPALAVALFLCFRTWRQRAIAIGAFTVASLLWLVPLVRATGGWNGFIDYEWNQARYVVAHDAAASRGSKTLLRVAARFILRAWGSSITIAAVAILFATGALPLLRHWRPVLPLAVFACVHLAFAVVAMDPADAVRYSLPAMPLFALAAALAFRPLRIPPWLGAGVLAALAVWYVQPILLDRVSGPSPVAAAARYIRTLARNTAVLHQAGMRAHVDWLLPEYPRSVVPGAPAVRMIDGISEDPRSKRFAWRESAAYTKMTRNFGRIVTVDPLLPEERFLPLRGVYPLESAPDSSAWQWLAPDAALRLPPLGKTRVALTFRLSPDAPYEMNTVHVIVNGRDTGGVIVRKTSGAAVVPFGNEIEIRSARSFRPDDALHNQDRRELAVQLLEVMQR